MEGNDQPAGQLAGGSSSGISRQGLYRITFLSLMGGATALIPVPILDDWVWKMIRRKMALEVFRLRETSLPKRELRLLVDSASLWRQRGCLANVIYFLVIAPVRFVAYILGRVFRKVFFLLAIKEAADRASVSFHEGYLWSHGARRLPGESLDERAALQLRYAVQETLQGVNKSPVWSVFWQLIKAHKALLRQAAMILRGMRKKGNGESDDRKAAEAEEMVDREVPLMRKITEQAADLISGEEDYLRSIEERLERFGAHRNLWKRAGSVESAE